MAVLTPSVNLKDNASALKDGLTQSQSDAVVIQMYLTAVELQPDIVQDIVPNLPATQAQARQSVTFWRNDVLPAMTQTVTDLISFANQWTAYKNTMLGYAQTIASTTSTQAEKDAARLNLDGMLGQVYSATESKEQNAINAHLKIKAFADQLTSTNSEFNAELKTLQDKFAGKSGVLAQLDAAIDELNSGIGKDAALIVVSAISVIGGGLMIAAGASATFITQGTSTELVLAGIGFVAAGIGGLAGAAADISKKVEDLGKLAKEKAEDEQMYAGIKTAISQVSGLDSKCSDAVNSANDLVNLWGDLRGDLDTLRTDVKAINPGDYSVLHAIQYADADWQACLAAAWNIQTNTAGGNPPVKTGVNGQYPFSHN